MDYTLNIVSKCRFFFFIFKHSRAPKRSWKIFHGGPGKSWIFLSVKEWEPWPCLRLVLHFIIYHLYVPPVVGRVAGMARSLELSKHASLRSLGDVVT